MSLVPVRHAHCGKNENKQKETSVHSSEHVASYMYQQGLDLYWL